MQRRGRTHRAAGMDRESVDAMALVTFFKQCRVDLEGEGKEDAAFYFAQCEDHLRAGGSLSAKQASKILGL